MAAEGRSLLAALGALPGSIEQGTALFCWIARVIRKPGNSFREAV
jgi:hypothetical protein